MHGALIRVELALRRAADYSHKSIMPFTAGRVARSIADQLYSMEQLTDIEVYQQLEDERP